MMTTRVAIIPGNGAGDVEYCNWYGWMRDKLQQMDGVEPMLRNMPDPVLARASQWLPFMKDVLKCDDNTIILGHSSGAVAAMRYAEKMKVKGIILVAAYDNDLGDEDERASGYFDSPWNWDKIRGNTSCLVQFASKDDPLVPFSEQQNVAEKLKSDFKVYDDMGHFCMESCPEILKEIKHCVT